MTNSDRLRGARRGLGAAAALLVLAVGCAAPSGGTVVGPGTYSGEFSIISPITYYFDGTAGDRLNACVVWYTGGETFTAPVTVTKSGGPVLTPRPDGGWDLPATDRYKLEFRYTGVDTFPHTYYFSLNVDEYRGVTGLGLLERAGPCGQRLTYTYEGAAGEVLNVYEATVFDPSGAEVPENGQLEGQHVLPVTGDYTVLVGARTAALSHDIFAGPIGLGRTALPVHLPGQWVRYDYAGSTAEALGVSSGAGAFGMSGTTVVAPGGTLLTGDYVGSPRLVLPDDGLYTVAALGGEIWLSHDLEAGELQVGANPVPGLVPGQSVAFDLTGSPGQVVQLRTTDNVPGVPPKVFLSDPLGSVLTFDPYDDGTNQWDRYTLSADGTHRVLVTPSHYPGSSLVVWYETSAP